MTKLVHLDADIRPYLAALLVAALYHHKEELLIPEGLNYREIPLEEFKELVSKHANKNYDSWGRLGN